MRAELERRASLTDAVRELADVGGFAAWRTRVSDARHELESDGRGTIRWNGQVKDSAYRYEPRIPTPDPPVQQVSLF